MPILLTSKIFSSVFHENTKLLKSSKIKHGTLFFLLAVLCNSTESGVKDVSSGSNFAAY